MTAGSLLDMGTKSAQFRCSAKVSALPQRKKRCKVMRNKWKGCAQSLDTCDSSG